jgi:hypothetical protein
MFHRSLFHLVVLEGVLQAMVELMTAEFAVLEQALE